LGYSDAIRQLQTEVRKPTGPQHMKLKSPNLKTSLTLVVALLSLLTFVVVGGSWYVQQRSKDTIDQFAAIGVQANSDVKNAYIYALLAVSKVEEAIKIDHEK